MKLEKIEIDTNI